MCAAFPAGRNISKMQYCASSSNCLRVTARSKTIPKLTPRIHQAGQYFPSRQPSYLVSGTVAHGHGKWFSQITERWDDLVSALTGSHKKAEKEKPVTPSNPPTTSPSPVLQKNTKPFNTARRSYGRSTQVASTKRPAGRATTDTSSGTSGSTTSTTISYDDGWPSSNIAWHIDTTPTDFAGSDDVFSSGSGSSGPTTSTSNSYDYSWPSSGPSSTTTWHVDTTSTDFGGSYGGFSSDSSSCAGGSGGDSGGGGGD